MVVCSDKRYPHYLGHLVLKEGVGEETVEMTLELMDRLGNLRTSIMGRIGDIQAQAQAEENLMALYLKAAL